MLLKKPNETIQQNSDNDDHDDDKVVGGRSCGKDAVSIVKC